VRSKVDRYSQLNVYSSKPITEKYSLLAFLSALALIYMMSRCLFAFLFDAATVVGEYGFPQTNEKIFKKLTEIDIAHCITFILSFIVLFYFVSLLNMHTGWVKKVSCCTVIDISKAS